ncbi:MAG: 3-phosphoglycerate dehydrogenase, partial [Lentisphaerae bacterium]|nr:3-phosphoglycerate dehydrogenase [Lentisphaerota bacterium]
MKKKVLIPTKLESVARQTLEDHGGYTVIQDEQTALADLVQLHSDAHALIVRSEKINAALIDALPHLTVIVRAGTG